MVTIAQDFYYVLQLACLTHLFVTSEPVILIKRYFGFREEDYDTMKPWMRFFHKLMSCHPCSGFWVGIIFTGNILFASMVSVCSLLLCKIIHKL